MMIYRKAIVPRERGDNSIVVKKQGLLVWGPAKKKIGRQVWTSASSSCASHGLQIWGISSVAYIMTSYIEKGKGYEGLI